MATKKKTAKRQLVSVKVKPLPAPVRTTIALAFDEWLRRYTKNPAGFQAEFKIVEELRAGKKANGATAYGNNCVTLLEKLMAEVHLKRIKSRSHAVRK